MKFWKTLWIVLCLVSVAGVQAQNIVTLGGHYWRAQPKYEGESFEGIDVSPGNMLGPYLNLRMGKVLIGSSMFFGNFKWTFTDFDLDFDIQRTDLNFNLGYAFFPRLNIFAAVKLISLKGAIEDVVVYDDWGTPYSMSIDTESKGTLFGGGVSGVVPLGRQSPLFLFWSAAYLTGTLENESTTRLDGQVVASDEPVESDTDVTAVTLGCGYQWPSGMTIMVGYRADISGEAELKEEINGFMATLAFTLR